MAQLTLPEIQAVQATLAQQKSKRMRILWGMYELMKTITTSRGYSHEVVEVTFDTKSWRDKSTPQTPVIFIIDSGYQLAQRNAGKTRLYKWYITLFGVVREKDLIGFEEFIADIEVALKHNNTLFGECNFMEVIEIITDNQYFSEFDGTHLYEMVVEVNFTRCFDDPL